MKNTILPRLSRLAAALILTLPGAAWAQAPGSQKAEAKAPDTGPPVLRLCTGKKGNNYHRAGLLLAKALEGKAKVEVLETKGSWDNLEGIDAKPRRCDAIIAQDDAYTLYQFERPESTLTMERVTALYSEYVHLMCNRKAGIEKVQDLRSGRHRVLIPPFGTGTYITWKLFSRLNPNFGRMRFAEASFEEALLKVVDGVQAQCVAMVSGVGSEGMKTANAQFGEQLRLVRLRDKSLHKKVGKERREVYQTAELDEDTYPKLLDDDFETTSVAAVFFISPEWKATHAKAGQELTLALLKILPEIRGSLQ